MSKAEEPLALKLADDLTRQSKQADAEDQMIDIPRWFVEDSAAELRRLHAENEALRKTLAASCDEEREMLWEATPGGGCTRALTAERENEALREDAERYRWLRAAL